MKRRILAAGGGALSTVVLLVLLVLLVLVLHAQPAVAQAAGDGTAAPTGATATATLPAVTVTATRHAESTFDVPASVDVIDARAIRDGEPQVNLSESLARIPGVFAANRQNYAQDLQISSRGFGARATFGVRGVRIYQDGIPATMPDGQGQTGSFSLLSAKSIEVLRGPFSALYGNASGGVISVFTEDPSHEPVATVTGGGGSYGQWTFGTKLSATHDRVGYVVAGSEFQTSGYRDHSRARRDLTNAKLVLSFDASTRITVIGNTQYQPETEDPLGLTRAEWSENPRGVDHAAILFDTRKTINQAQGGVALDHALSDALELHVDGYGGRRLVRQYLAFTGSGDTSSGGITDLDGNFGGVGARLVWRAVALGRPLTLTVGGDWNRQDQLRRGFVNDFGAMGDLRRDETDDVTGNDAYAQAEWEFARRWSATAGVRTSSVRYTSVDHYVTGANGNDSGNRDFSNTSPVAGVVFHATDNVNLYTSYGEGFETPTFTEIAYRDNGTGLNFALQPATSRAFEVGAKFLWPDGQRLNLAWFDTDTHNEIVVDRATGGRTTYKNASATHRQGAEALWDAALGHGMHARVALTWLRAVFADAFSSGTPPATVPAGARLPGVPSREAWAELDWAPQGATGFNAALETQYADKLYVNERNSDAAPSYAAVNARVGYGIRTGAATWTAFARVNNLFDRRYAGSVIVNDSNGRYFEPAPGRNWFAGATVRVAL
ncbi:MAG TPA: TonB-dependent receptor [Casimicrobiaceae bacterium]